MGSHHDHRKPDETTAETQGVVWDWAWRYDLLIGLVTVGRERAFRRRTAELAQLQPGETVLDVGCGTGTLAILAKECVGATGHVAGIDPSWQMIARAHGKAEQAGLSIDFRVGVIEQLPFPDQSFNVVLSTFMMHHLPDSLKRRGLSEIARVLQPGGRLLVLDFRAHAGPWKRSIWDLPALLSEARFSSIESRKAGFPGLGIVRARKHESACQPGD